MPDIDIVLPDGREATVEQEHLEQALSLGAQVDTPELKQARARKEEFGDRPIAAGALGFSSGLSFGLIPQALESTGLVSEETQLGLKEENVGAYTTGEIGSIAASLLAGGLPGIAGATAKTAGAGVRGVAALGRGVEKVAATAIKPFAGEGLAAHLLSKTAGAALEGGLYGAGQVVSEDAMGETELTADSILSRVGLGALVGGGAGGVLGALGYGVQRAGKSLGPLAEKLLPEKLRTSSPAAFVDDLADDAAVSSVGLRPSDFGKIRDKQATAKALRTVKHPDGRQIILPGQGPDVQAGRISDVLDVEGKNVRAFYKQLDDNIVAATADDVVRPARIADEIEARLVKPLSGRPAQAHVARRMQEVVDDYRSQGGRAWSFDEVWTQVKDWKGKARFNMADPPDITVAYQEVRDIIKTQLHDQAEQFAAKALPEGAFAEFKQANRRYADLATIGDLAEKRAQRAIGLRVTQPSDLGVGAAVGVAEGVASGSSLMGLAKGGAATFVHKFVRERGNSVAAYVLDKASKLRILNRASQDAPRKIEGAVKAFIDGGRRVRESAPASVSVLYDTNLGAPAPRPKSRVAAYHARLAELTELASDQQRLSMRLERNVGPIADAAPKVAQSVMTRATQVSAFLLEKAPKDPRIGRSILPPLRQYQPSDFELAKWERYFAAAVDPMTVVDDLEAGRLSKEGVETMRTLYPSMYDRIRSTVTATLSQRATDPDFSLPFAAQLHLAILFDVPIPETEPASLAAYQGSFTLPDPEIAEMQEQRQRARSEKAAQTETVVERVAGR